MAKKTRVSAKNINPFKLSDEVFEAIMEDFEEPLAELGRRWAKSPHRPRPEPAVLRKWERLLDKWVANRNLPLIIRKSIHKGKDIRGKTGICSNGRKVIFSDNTPANWSFGRALVDDMPNIQSWNSDSIQEHIPLKIFEAKRLGKRDLNELGWRVCHIKPLGENKIKVTEESKRFRVEATPDVVEDAFRRLLSPANIFLIPKEISGAGELPQVIDRVAACDQHQKIFNPGN